MPIVFVHGVNVRKGAEYDRELQVRSAMLRHSLRPLLSGPGDPLILNPYWGDSGVSFRWNHASLPSRGSESFGGADDTASLLLANFLEVEASTGDDVLLSVARRSLPDAVDLAVAAAATLVNKPAGAAEQLARWSMSAAEIARDESVTAWLPQVRSDNELLRELDNRVLEREPTSDEEQFGLAEVRDRLREAGIRLADAPARASSAALLASQRTALHERATRFLGDVFVYLMQRERGSLPRPGEILGTVLAAIQEAWDRRTENDPQLVLIGHSMGGNILYELLSHYLPRNRSPIHADVLVTVGSQVGVFEEMKLFAASDPAVPADPDTDRVPLPAAVGRWINVFDRNDAFSFAAEPIFAGARDFNYATGKGLLGAHGAYFTLPSFHRRLRERLREVLR